MSPFKSLLLLPILCILTSCQARAEVIRLSGTIDDDMAVKISTQLEKAEHPILVINSPGGSVFAAYDIIQSIHLAKNPVICVVDGMAASAAALIEESCQFRAMTRGSLMMIHQAASGAQGQPDDLRNGVNTLEAVDLAMEQAISDASNGVLSVEDVAAKIAHGAEWWIGSSEALATGLVQKIL